ncbi:hypothetical protein JOF55_003830 [Haloactinomyces albus]|uniref:Uncharacterized protein n=1 Tax=Haloactinomyces albus TaxID=1352928 RepID=A0AAE3ZHE1_9ACTN|nr:hypothetical protein [Haloactinomyces albus]
MAPFQVADSFASKAVQGHILAALRETLLRA